MVNLYETHTVKGSEVNERTKYRLRECLTKKALFKIPWQFYVYYLP